MGIDEGVVDDRGEAVIVSHVDRQGVRQTVRFRQFKHVSYSNLEGGVQHNVTAANYIGRWQACKR